MSSSRWRAPSPVLCLLVAVALGPFGVFAANETEAEQAQNTSANLKALALLQGTDGGSGAMGFLWAAFCFLMGTPLLVAGLKLMRLTCGAGLGLVLGFVVWVAFINSAPTNGFASTPFLSDVLITIPALALASAALALGLFHPARYIGHILLCASGAIAFVLQLMLFREGLLVPLTEVIWGLVALATLLGLVLGVMKQRLAVLTMSSMSGSFLLSLGVDLVLNRQQGMSFGLRVIFDNNDAHETMLVRSNYKPTLSTQIILGVGFAFAVIGSIAQHFLYPGNFIQRPLSKQWSDLLAPPADDGLPPTRRTTKFYAEDVEPGFTHVRPSERGIASSSPAPEMLATATSLLPSQQQRYQEEQRVMYEEQQRFARERQAFASSGGIRQIATHQYSPAPSFSSPRPTGTLTPEQFFDPSHPMMRPPTLMRPVRNESPIPPPPQQHQTTPWRSLAVPSRDLPDRSANSSPSSVYSQGNSTFPEDRREELLGAAQRQLQSGGKDRPLADEGRGEGGGSGGRRYEAPSLSLRGYM